MTKTLMISYNEKKISPITMQRHEGPEIISTAILIVSISYKPATISHSMRLPVRKDFSKNIKQQYMKFYLSVIAATILITTTANAQHVNLGLKAGLNLYNIHNSNGAEYDTKAGFHAGLIGHIHLARQFALQPELLYSAQGAKYTAAGVESKLNLGYINVPVMFQYMFDNGFRLQAGPQVGFMINAKSETNDNKTDVKDNFKTVDFGLGAGVGYVHTPSGFGVDARYNFGLSSINENSAVKSTNRGLQLGVFYLFKHK